MAKRVEHRQSFKAEDESWRPQTLHVYIEILDAATIGDPDGEVEGMKHILTNDNRRVNRLDKGKYQIVGGSILTSDDPDAP